MQGFVYSTTYFRSSEDEERVLNIMKEQFAKIDPEIHDVVSASVVSIGHRTSKIANEAILEHFNKGNEDRTLHALWEYCRTNKNSDAKVVYLHSKGSFHPHSRNDMMRRFLTEGALSHECAKLPDSCNVCSSRMSPLPHPHTPGNMWLARCDYVAKLIDPQALAEGKLAKNYYRHNSCRGFGRYFFEHWAHSHPSVLPCDLYPGKEYTWDYKPIPVSNFTKDLQNAPRFKFDNYVHRGVCGGSLLDYWRDLFWDYEQLYNITTVDQSWWGWKIFTI